MPTVKTACFFSHVPRPQLQKEQYSIQDIRILRDLGYDVTVATSYRGVPWHCDLYFSWWASGSVLPLIKARLSRRPIIVVAGGNDSMFFRDSVSGTPYGYLATPWYKKLAARLSLRFGTVILVVSRFMVGDVSRLGAHQPIIVANSVDTDAFCPSTRPRSFVTSMFTLDDQVVAIKRGEIFIRCIPFVLATYPDQRFVVIGEKGNAFRRLNDLAAELGIQRNIEFLGSIDNAEVAGWLQASEVYVQISDTETFGVAIAEAMSTGTPVVVTRRGGVPELVEDCGVYVDHNDPRSVAAGIVEVLAMPRDERDRIGLAARARILEHFSYERRKAAVARVIQTLE